MPTDSILNHIRRIGYTVSIHRVNGTIEMHAVKLDGSEAPQIARCDDGDGTDETYRCACLLAQGGGYSVGRRISRVIGSSSITAGSVHPPATKTSEFATQNQVRVKSLTMSEAAPRIYQDERVDGQIVLLIPERFQDGTYHLHERVGATSNRRENAILVASEDELVERLMTGRYYIRLTRQDGRSLAPTLRAPQRLNIPEAGQIQRSGKARQGGRAGSGDGGGVGDDLDENPFTPNDEDRRPIAQRAIRERQGQHRFKLKLFERYGAACMVSGCQVFDVLEAAHILQYLGPSDNHRENGLLLRADIHSLFDADLVGVEPETRLIYINPILQGTEYWGYNEQGLRCGALTPSLVAMRIKWGYYRDRLHTEAERSGRHDSSII